MWGFLGCSVPLLIGEGANQFTHSKYAIENINDNITVFENLF